MVFIQAVAAFALLCIAASNAESTGKCNLVPNVIPTPTNYSIGQLLTAGPWYGYSTYNTDTGKVTQNPSDLNVVNYYTSHGKSREPTRTQPAEIIVQEKRRYVNGSCMYNLESSIFTTDGRQFGTVFDVDAKSTVVDVAYDESIIWSTDQKTYIVFFWCAEHNWQSGNCGSTHIYVYTQTKPNALTDDQKQSITSAVDTLLKPYCIKSDQFAQYKHDDSLPECPKAKYPECFTHNVNAVKKLVDKKDSKASSNQKGAKGAKDQKSAKGSKNH